MIDVPVYLFTGFLESGKTSCIKGLLTREDFMTGEKSLIICCEEGIEEYEENLLKPCNAQIVKVKKEEEITEEFFQSLDKKYEPERVFIEYNGMWNISKMVSINLPEYWGIAQIIALVDASTFSVYMGNMRSIMVEQFKYADLVMFNRSNEDTNKLAIRGSVKAVNRKAALVFELENGQIDESEDRLPFDINAPVIEMEEYDFGLWYADVMSNPNKYENKRIKLMGKVTKQESFPENFFVLGRDAMTCCQDDINFIGVICKCAGDKIPESNSWIEATASIKLGYMKQHDSYMPVLAIESFSDKEKPAEELIYF